MHHFRVEKLAVQHIQNELMQPHTLSKLIGSHIKTIHSIALLLAFIRRAFVQTVLHVQYVANLSGDLGQLLWGAVQVKTMHGHFCLT